MTTQSFKKTRLDHPSYLSPIIDIHQDWHAWSCRRDLTCRTTRKPKPRAIDSYSWFRLCSCSCRQSFVSHGIRLYIYEASFLDRNCLRRNPQLEAQISEEKIFILILSLHSRETSILKYIHQKNSTFHLPFSASPSPRWHQPCSFSSYLPSLNLFSSIPFASSLLISLPFFFSSILSSSTSLLHSSLFTPIAFSDLQIILVGLLCNA